jgi:hypothetical protein
MAGTSLATLMMSCQLGLRIVWLEQRAQGTHREDSIHTEVGNRIIGAPAGASSLMQFVTGEGLSPSAMSESSCRPRTSLVRLSFRA